MKIIDANELKGMMDDKEDFVLLDTRSHDDYDKEHLPGARSLPSDHVGKDMERDYSHEAKIVTYCKDPACESSVIAARKLERYGFKNVAEFRGGIAEWKNRKYPTVTKGH